MEFGLVDGWEGRVQEKLLAAALITGIGSAVTARRKGLPATDSLLAHLAGYVTGAGCFCGAI